jgi:protein SCO1
MINRLCAAVGIVLSLWFCNFACQRESTPEPAKVASDKRETTTYQLSGTVKKINREASEVHIAHKAIPGFMAAMTMPFTLKQRSVFDDLEVGDEVVGILVVERENGVVADYELKDLSVTRPAVEPEGAAANIGKIDGASPRLKVGDEIPDFEMTTQEGKKLSLLSLRGDVVVFTFIYTRCPLPDFCPLMDRKFANLAQKLANVPKRAEHVRLLSISFDPEHDTPEVLQKHAQVQGAQPPLWTFAVASHDELAKVAARLGLMYGPTKNEIVHNLCTVVVGPDGKIARIDVGSDGRKWEPVDYLKLINTLAP